jgi:membrane fusion protein, multidrug efflux system
MKRYVICALIASSLVLEGCGGSSADERSTSETSSPATVSVQVRTVETVPFTDVLQVVGILKGIDDILVSAEEGGVVQHWRYQRGQTVPRESVLVLLKDDVPRASYDAALSQYRIAELTYEKQLVVYKEQGISELQLKNSEYNRDAARAQAELMYARWQRMRLRSPITGVLEDRFIDIAELASPGMPIARVVRIDSIRILITVPEKYASSVRKKSRVWFTVPSLGRGTFDATVMFVGSTVSPDNHTLSVEALSTNPGGVLKPEMIARVHIESSAPRETILVERHLLQQLDRRRMVLYVVEDGVARERIVTIGAGEESRVEILNGLQPGDRLVISGQERLVDGQPVTLEEEGR